MSEQSESEEGGPFRLVREKVLHEVRRAIALGTLEPGARLTERALCETYGISRTAAREVIRQLDAEKLGEVVPHQGLRIARLTPKAVREIYEIRAEMEVLITRAFIALATEEEVAVLKGLVDALNDATARGDIEALVAHSSRYVSHMYETADMQIAGELMQHLNARITLVRVLAMREPGQISAGIGQLERIRARIAARDPDGAEAEIRKYMRTALASALHQLGGDPA
ncbi:GntR family transcriptional regulator [Oceaniglobus roseus]|uniref:GntR family transcriptional regulator n=1 Tax=Oceaniglobus roseus TaxID=1737570 RepID=UPI000C7F1CFA|nr:GntR family transcriptional regulator [Kandeliimicrobium roseum]